MTGLPQVTIAIILLSLTDEAYAHRSTSAKHAFQYVSPCPNTGKTKGHCEGYIIDQSSL